MNENNFELVETPSEDISLHHDDTKYNQAKKNILKYQRVVYPLVVIIIILLIVILEGSAGETKKQTDSIKEEDEFIFDYPTIGIPIPGKIYNSTPVAK